MNGKFNKYGFDLNGQMLDDLVDVIDEYGTDVCLAIPKANGDGCWGCYVPNKIAALFKGAIDYTTGDSTDDLEARTKQLKDWLYKVVTNDEAMKKLGHDIHEYYPEVYLCKQIPEGYFSFCIHACEDMKNVTGEWCNPFWGI